MKKSLNDSATPLNVSTTGELPVESSHLPKENIATPEPSDPTTEEQSIAVPEANDTKTEDTSIADPKPSDATKGTRSSPTKKMIAVSEINLTEEYHLREKENPAAIAAYEKVYRDYVADLDKWYRSKRKKDAPKEDKPKCPLGVISVLEDKGGKYHVTSGWHRVKAARNAEVDELPCEIYTDRVKAIKAGIISNRHGQPLTKMDKIKEIKNLLVLDPTLSNHGIAEITGFGVSSVHVMVRTNKLRPKEDEPANVKKKRKTASKPRDPALASLHEKMEIALKPTSRRTCTPQQYILAFMDALEILVNEGTVEAACLELLKEASGVHNKT